MNAKHLWGEQPLVERSAISYMKIVWRWKASSKFSCDRLWLMSFPSHFLCRQLELEVPVEESSVPQSLVQPSWVVSVGASPGQISREGARSVSPSISTHRAGCSSVPLGTDKQGHGRFACGAGFVSALGWWRQPYLPCAAYTGAVAQRPVWHVLQVSAGRDLRPWDLALLLRSGEASEVVSMWDPWCTQLLALLTFAATPGQENGAAPGLGIILLMVVTMLCCCILASA